MRPGTASLILIAFVFALSSPACRKNKFGSSDIDDKIATVSTVAGTGTLGYKDGGGSTAEFLLMRYLRNAEFNRPSGVAADADGNVYVADGGNGLIRKISPDGGVSTICNGFANAENEFTRFFNARDVAADSEGNVYVADDIGHCIVKIVPTGQATIFAGGDYGFEDEVGTRAKFRSARGIATDIAGNVYVADQENNRIRKITPNGEVSTLAGSGEPGYWDGQGTDARFDSPADVATDPQGNVLVADYYNDLIRLITPDGTVTTYAFVERPQTLTADAHGNVYVADLDNKIFKIAPDQQVTNFAGDGTYGYANGQGSAARFYSPEGLAADAQGNIFVGDKGNNRIRKITSGGEVSNFAGNGVAGVADNVDALPEFRSPAGVATDIQGNVYVADIGNGRIRKIAPGGEVTTLAGNDEDGFADGKGTEAKFYWPTGIATDFSGNVYVADTRNHRIRKISPDGTVTTIAGNGTAGYHDGTDINNQQFNNPVALTLDAAGNIYVADADNHCIRKISPMGDVSTFAGNGEQAVIIGGGGGFQDAIGTAARFDKPWGIAADAQGNLFVADSGCHCIRKISTTAQVTTIAGDLRQSDYTVLPGYLNGNGTSSRFNAPAALTVDTEGRVFVADANNNCIRVLSSVGNEKYIVSTIAGVPVPGFADGGDSNARFNAPAGLAIDLQGNIYVADAGNHSIRKIIRK